MRREFFFLLCAMASCLADSALAQHTEHVAATAQQTPVAVLSVHTERSTFRFPYQTQGTAVLVMPTADLRLTDNVTMFLTAPVGVVNVRDTPAGWGLSDVSLGASWRLGNLASTIRVMLPTGDSHLGLGAQHVMLALQSSVSIPFSVGLFRAALGGQGAVGTSQHRHQSLVMPMDVFDVRARVGLRRTIFERFFAALSTEGVWAVVPNPVAPVGTRLNVLGSAGVTVGAVQLSVGATVAALGRSAQPLVLEALISSAFF
jgi:hypothetical protein